MACCRADGGGGELDGTTAVEKAERLGVGDCRERDGTDTRGAGAEAAREGDSEGDEEAAGTGCGGGLAGLSSCSPSLSCEETMVCSGCC